MKKLISLMAVTVMLVMVSGSVFAQDAQNGFGNKNNNGRGQGLRTNWVDSNGDGVCDNVGTDQQRAMQNKRINNENKSGNGQGYGKGNKGHYGDGTGLRPQDGNGFGRKAGMSGSGSSESGGNRNNSGGKGHGRRGGNK
jgi:hypothetical protein